MISNFLASAEAGHPVYISSVHEAFNKLDDSESQSLHCYLTMLENDEQRYFLIRTPLFGSGAQRARFISEYVWAELYNILSSLGGRRMDIYIDESATELRSFAERLNDVFGIDKSRAERRGYGRAVNVTDRMLDTLAPGSPGFKFNIYPLDKMPPLPAAAPKGKPSLVQYSNVIKKMDGKLFCGIDVGGTDIKVVLVKDGSISSYKEYDWFPASFTTSKQLVEPICLIVRLMQAKASLDAAEDSPQKGKLSAIMTEALENAASEELMQRCCIEVEDFLSGSTVKIDAVGMCFPDVVVRNKIVGGEVYKTRGIRDNPDIDYEKDFAQLTNLNDRIHELIKEDGRVSIINDGPMASFTAAVETAASDSPRMIENGVFAHTLGTELGTGWVTEEGRIPDIPLEVYNYIIDLGSYPERDYAPDDLRSINNFNTSLPGTLQKYTSQSGVFRLALKYFPDERPELFNELIELGYVSEEIINGAKGYFVPTEPRDQRKPFLEHMMSLPERENDEVNKRIWNEIGEFLAVTWIETKKILNPAADSRVLFGRLVKRRCCFDLMCEGAGRIRSDIRFEVADSTIANTDLMKQLESDPHFTVAQFAQAVGAAYFANQA